MFPIEHFLLLAALLFSMGLLIIVTKRNTIMILFGIELMLNASNLNLVAFNTLLPESVDGQIFALFVIIVAVSEAAVGLAIVLQVYQYYQTSIPDSISELKE
jgi:NADH:ubiquinone oxidoreductase subunit K